MIAAVNNDEEDVTISIPYSGSRESFTGLLSGETYEAEGGKIQLPLKACKSDILF